MNKLTKTLSCLFFSLLIGTAQGQNSTGMVLLEMESGVAMPGETVCLDLNGSGMADILGMQFSVRWDPNLLDFVEVTGFELEGMSNNDFGMRFIDQGALTFAYIVPLGTAIPDTSSLFTVCLRAKDGASGYSAVTLSDSPTALEFVVDIENVAQIIRNYTLLGGQIIFPGNSTTEVPLSLNVKNELMTNCLIEGSTNINVEATGGTPPYTYAWTGPFGYTNTGADLFLERSGEFELLVTDAEGRTLIARFAVHDSDLNINGITGTDNPCPGAGAGSIDLSAEGGEGTRIYKWSNGATVEDPSGLEGGTYSVTVSDQVGCATVESITIGSGSGISINPAATPPNCGASDGSIRLNAQSAAGGLFYNWQGNLDGDQVTGLSPGTYAVTVLDNEGCQVTAEFDFSWDPLASTLTVDCYADENNQIVYEARAAAQGGTGPFTFNWSTGASVNQVTNSQTVLPGSGSYALTITDAEGCTDQQSFDVAMCGAEHPVWPGDTDNNGEVSHFDLLNIGLGYGQEGPAREAASLVWQSQAALAWDRATPVSAVNFKYADTNGDGRIEAADTVAIVQHWGRITGSGGGGNPGVPPPNAAPLFVEGQVVPPGTQVLFNISLGDNSQDVQGAYGIAFSIVYDPMAVVGESVKALLKESWMGSADLLMIQRNDPTANRIDLAITRADLSNRSGFGAIAQLQLRTREEIPNQQDRYDMVFRVENVRLSSVDEQEIEVTPMESTAVLEGTTAINDPAILQKITLFPNPAHDQVRLEAQDLNVQLIELLNASGQRMRAWQRAGSLDLRHISPGAYWLRIATEEGIASKKVVVMP